MLVHRTIRRPPVHIMTQLVAPKTISLPLHKPTKDELEHTTKTKGIQPSDKSVFIEKQESQNNIKVINYEFRSLFSSALYLVSILSEPGAKQKLVVYH